MQKLTEREEYLVDALLEIQDWDWHEGQYEGTAGYPASVVADGFKKAGIRVKHSNSNKILRCWKSHGITSEQI
jgi:hypothetical protein